MNSQDKEAWGRMVVGTPLLMVLMIIAAIALVAGAKAAMQSPDSTVNVERPASMANGQQGGKPTGQSLFLTNCSACHGQDAKGGVGKNLVTSAFLKGLSDSEAATFIKTGRPVGDPANTTGIAMPPKGGNAALTDEDIAAIVSFLRSIAQ